MCESERPATQVHADSAWERRLDQNPIISAQGVSRDFVFQGGSVCITSGPRRSPPAFAPGAAQHALWTSPVDGLKRQGPWDQTDLRLKTGFVVWWLVRT